MVLLSLKWKQLIVQDNREKDSYKSEKFFIPCNLFFTKIDFSIFPTKLFFWLIFWRLVLSFGIDKYKAKCALTIAKKWEKPFGCFKKVVAATASKIKRIGITTNKEGRGKFLKSTFRLFLKLRCVLKEEPVFNVPPPT